ncbi:MAG: NADH-quinone oxidoreductase subunit C [Methanobacteriota archaeon]|nr:MAG: NADH-quinone oxidoreductase subunit C [Euryarchaeota archaeon]
MKGTEVAQAVKEKFKDLVSNVSFPRDRVVRLYVPRESILPFCKFLRDELSCEHLSLVTAVDWPENFECVYHITSYLEEYMVELHVKIPKDDPKVDSLSPVWKGADFAEWEAYDMMGITFVGHPDLRRILLPEDYLYYPLRKDFKG